MALPIRAPAATPPRMPAPTAQPTQSAFAGAGAIIAAMAMPTALTDAMSNLCMCFPPRARSVPIRAVNLNPKELLNRLVGVRAAPEKCLPGRRSGVGARALRTWGCGELTHFASQGPLPRSTCEHLTQKEGPRQLSAQPDGALPGRQRAWDPYHPIYQRPD